MLEHKIAALESPFAADRMVDVPPEAGYGYQLGELTGRFGSVRGIQTSRHIYLIDTAN